MNNFTELPSELLLIIFNNLSTIDLIRIKQVCKRWYNEINTMKIKDLIITNRSNENYCTFKTNETEWFLIEKSIDQNKMIKLNLSTKCDLFIFKDQILFSKLFSKLKRLMIDNCFNLKYITYLSHFHNLEHLDLNIDITSTILIFHPNLKIICLNSELNIDEFCEVSTFFLIEIDAHNLEYLKHNGWYKLVEVFEKDKIKYLDRNFLEAEQIYGTTDEIFEKFADDYSADLSLYDNPDEYYKDNTIDEYSNLEVLVCDKISNLKVDQLNKLTKLKKVIFKIPKYFSKDYTRTEFKNEFNQFMEEKILSKLYTLQIYLIKDDKIEENLDELDYLLGLAKKTKTNLENTILIE